MKVRDDDEELVAGELDTDRIPVRSLLPSDLATVVAIDRASTGESRVDFYRTKIQRAIDDSSVQLSLAAELDDHVVGFLIVSFYYGEFGVPEKVAVVEAVGVHPDYRGQKVGKALLRQLEINLRGLGVEKIRTQVNWEQQELIGFLARAGYRPEPRLSLEKSVSWGLAILLVLLPSLLAACSGSGSGSSVAVRSAPRTFEEAGGQCISCHLLIEDAHPKKLLYCTDCHGGDDATRDIHRAHVQPRQELPLNPIILPVDYPDKEYLRFLNPSNLRVITQTCGRSDALHGTGCHPSEADTILKSMMATTTGHLAGGAYQNQHLPDRTAIWGNMEVADDDGDVPAHRGGLAMLTQLPPEDTRLPFDSIERHYSDAARKICIRCHLWSAGKAVRGVPGQEGNYRAEGCAACHMPYENDALSQSGDFAIDKFEVGHPRLHQITRQIPSEQCAHCHTRGARIGLSFQGLSQLPPGTPTGDDYPGLTPKKIYGAYHVQDPSVNPPDIHHERGMHCIDCHTKNEIMGDGNIYGHMDQATEIECEDCHGSVDGPGDLVTVRGTPFTHVRVENGVYILRSKVTGRDHVVPQVVDIVNEDHPRYNPRAALAMTPRHLKAEGGLECYTCHASWQNNCWGCHFNRDLGATALDMIEGENTYGKPATDDKYFLNYKNFQMGYNAEGKVAPYVVGCQVVTTVVAEDGTKVLDQAMPRTGEGFSGLALNPVNPHTSRVAPRWCTECHRSEPSLGTGSETFTLARKHLYVSRGGAASGLEVLDRRDPEGLRTVGSVPLTDPRGIALRMDQIVGEGRHVYVASSEGLVTVDVSVPASPRVTSTVPTTDARQVYFTENVLYLADGAGGLRIFGIDDPAAPVALAEVNVSDARAVRVSGGYAYVAGGSTGLLAVIDVLDPARPRVETLVDLGPGAVARDVFIFSHYANPPLERRPKDFSILAYVACGTGGVKVVDIGDPAAPLVLATFPTTDARALLVASVYIGGGSTERSLEREFLLVADGAGGLRILDVSEPGSATLVAAYPAGGSVTAVSAVHAFEPPVNRLYAYLAVEGGGLVVLDLSKPDSPLLVPSSQAPLLSVAGIAPERIRLDRLVDETGRKVKDSSHEGARPFTREEMDRILRAPIVR